MKSESVAEGRAARSGSIAPSRIAYWATLMFVSVVLLLHGLKPETDPAWRFLSEYALGAHGWLMNVAFVVFSVAHVALVVALDGWLRETWLGRVAQALLAISAAGLGVAGVFTTDSVMTPPGDATLSGQLHNVGGAMGVAMPLAVAVVTWRLLRHVTWAGAKRALVGSASFALVGAVVSMVSLGVLLSRSGGTFGPDVPVGWRNRFELATYCIWFLVVARTALSTAEWRRHEEGRRWCSHEGACPAKGARWHRCVPDDATGVCSACARGAATHDPGGCAGSGGVDQLRYAGVSIARATARRVRRGVWTLRVLPDECGHHRSASAPS